MASEYRRRNDQITARTSTILTSRYLDRVNALFLAGKRQSELDQIGQLLGWALDGFNGKDHTRCIPLQALGVFTLEWTPD